ncbi:MAG: NAD+ synthase, partial [Firmicutes bacterium]|nr:NAD+ synthase [Bacillota bacterium]
MKGIRIALAQICPVPGDAGTNAEKIKAYMKEAADGGAELVIFPECSLTGYAPERASELALSIGAGPDGAAELALSIGDAPDGAQKQAPGIGGGPISAIEEAAEKL